MRFLKKFESIEEKDLQETIDEVLDNLSKTSKLSKSEKEFMDEATQGFITKITTPKLSGNFWSDMSNPHNIGIMWIGKDKVWKQLKDLSTEIDEELEKTESSDEKWNRKQEELCIKYSEENPGLKDALNKYLDIKIKQSKEIEPFIKEINKFKDYKKNYNLSQKIEYALSSQNSLLNQFGPILNKKIDPDTGEFIKNININK